MFVPPFFSLDPIDPATGGRLGYPIGDPIEGSNCEATCELQRDVGLCCRPRVEGEDDCPVMSKDECEGSTGAGQGVLIPFSKSTKKCLQYMAMGACGR